MLDRSSSSAGRRGRGGLGGLTGQSGGGGAVGPVGTPDLSNNGDMVEFMGYVLDDANDLWADTFQRVGRDLQPGRRWCCSRAGRSRAAAPASSETGPFYCPADQKVYLDLDFFKELSDRFGAPRRLRQAYVIAHEVGHHVQQQTGHRGPGPRAPGSRTRAARTSCR